MTIREPSTFASDLLLSATSLGFGLALVRAVLSGHRRSTLLWGVALFAGSGTALLGAVYHGFGPALGPVTAAWIWRGTVWLAGLSSLTSVWGSAVATLPARIRRPVVLLAGLKFGVFAVWMATHDDFRFVVRDQLVGMAAILLLHLCAGRVKDNPADRLMVTGVIAALVAALLQRSGLDLHRHFNHNDLFHVAQIGANFLYFRGALLLRDHDGTSGAR